MGFDPSLKRPAGRATLESCDTTKQSVDDSIYTLAKELTSASRVIQKLI